MVEHERSAAVQSHQRGARRHEAPTEDDRGNDLRREKQRRGTNDVAQ